MKNDFNDIYSEYINTVKCGYLLPDSETFQNFTGDETFIKGRADIVFFPESHEHIEQILKISNKNINQGAPGKFNITIRGGGSGLSGAAVPEGGIVLSSEKMNKIFSIDEKLRSMHVQAGVSVESIRMELLHTRLFFPPDPSSASVSSIGGNIATRASGPRSFKYGHTGQFCRSIRVVFGNGESAWLGGLTEKDSTGFDIKSLIAGSEGRLAIITEVILKLIYKPEDEIILLCGLDSEKEAFEFICRLNDCSLNLTSVEFVDHAAVDALREKWPSEAEKFHCIVLIEITGNNRQIETELEYFNEAFPEISVITGRDAKSSANIMKARKSITESLKRIKKNKIGEDYAVPIFNMFEFTVQIRKICKAESILVYIWGHAGQGNLHVNMLFDNEEELNKIYKIMDQLSVIVVNLKGTFSGEHGLGKLKLKYKPEQYSENIIQFENEICKIFDPYNVLNTQLKNLC